MKLLTLYPADFRVIQTVQLSIESPSVILKELPPEQPFVHLSWSDRKRREERHILTSLTELTSASSQGEKRGRTCL